MQPYKRNIRLAEILKRNRLQQKHVTDALGVSRMALYNWLRGRAVPGGDNLMRLVEYLRKFEPGITAEQLLPTSGLMSDTTSPAPDADRLTGIRS